MTPEEAAKAAAEMLTDAQEHTSMPEVAAALVGIADGWTRLYTALANAGALPLDQHVASQADLMHHETVHHGVPTVTLGWPTIREQADIPKLGAELATTPTTSSSATDAVYRERAALVAHLAAVYPSAIVHNADRDDPQWPIIFVDTPQGQLSWHFSPVDLDLFEHVREFIGPWVPGAPRWDGHTTDEKYERLAAAVQALHTDARFPLQP